MLEKAGSKAKIGELIGRVPQVEGAAGHKSPSGSDSSTKNRTWGPQEVPELQRLRPDYICSTSYNKG